MINTIQNFKVEGKKKDINAIMEMVKTLYVLCQNNLKQQEVSNAN
jgi:hypothetical protein